VSASSPRLWRPVGFLLLMIGLGLRLDTSWQTFAAVLIVAGAAAASRGFRRPARREEPRAFVAPTGGG
jgi:hypothetical protein